MVFGVIRCDNNCRLREKFYDEEKNDGSGDQYCSWFTRSTCLYCSSKGSLCLNLDDSPGPKCVDTTEEIFVTYPVGCVPACKYGGFPVQAQITNVYYEKDIKTYRWICE
jgi:hypothetical protein